MNSAKFTVTVLGFDQALASAITGALDVFAFAGISWQRIHNLPTAPQFKVQLASHHGQSILCSNQVVLQPNIAIEDVSHTDVLLIPTIGGDIDEVLNDTQPLLVHIKRLQKMGADIAANCTGNFLLAQTGLLNNKTATTHWGYADKFENMFPSVNLQPEKMVTEDDTVYCAGGGMAWIDLSILLIERYCGHQIASDTAKSHVLDVSRTSQTVYASSRQRRFHTDQDIKAVQSFLERNLQNKCKLSDLAHQHNMTERTLIRRFKNACDTTPGQYLQSLRIEHARKLLETSSMSLESLISAVGYEDLSSFTRLFKKTTGLSPSQYRAKFKRN
ncbi:GlxA family transcriptional regulator [Alteromonas sp. PRIM-21]|uniref:GlxA family transcriptional regulator n=1 Tax=Alteromonas sp. PRIM-21 TaxID=1454978 RepID=UPI0022B9A588|nr:helix-turn-helix domain-containing protein [Alteromonas sp. PRIM-21]MCZ8530404.1 helix-turn-helix domain-containing protein [Alteromonas sp. PRIM-21]